jgi:hypothetical protein
MIPSLLLLWIPIFGPQAEPQETPSDETSQETKGDSKYSLLGLPAEIVRFIRLPGGGRHPRSVMDDDGLLHVVFFRMSEGELSSNEIGDVFYTCSPDEGVTFTEPVRLNAQSGGVSLGRGANGPSIGIAGGVVHVLMAGSEHARPRGPAGESPLLYVRRPVGSEEFEPQRNLIDSAWGMGTGVAVAADEEGGVHCFWTAPSSANVERQGVWYVRSTDGGKTFAGAKVINASDNGVSMKSAIDAKMGSNGRIVATYRSKVSKRRDSRLLISSDRGDSFADSTKTYTARKKDPASGTSISPGATKKFLLLSWEENGEVAWSYLLPREDSVSLPMVPKLRQKRIQRNPAVATNRSIAGALVWMEKIRGAEDETFRIAYQVWDITGRRPIGRGLAPGTSAGSTPSIFVRSDDGFGVLY